jgi:hypothetical protein
MLVNESFNTGDLKSGEKRGVLKMQEGFYDSLIVTSVASGIVLSSIIGYNRIKEKIFGKRQEQVNQKLLNMIEEEASNNKREQQYQTDLPETVWKCFRSLTENEERFRDGLIDNALRIAILPQSQDDKRRLLYGCTLGAYEGLRRLQPEISPRIRREFVEFQRFANSYGIDSNKTA